MALGIEQQFGVQILTSSEHKFKSMQELFLDTCPKDRWEINHQQFNL